jgi:hypothetical protein
MEMFGEHGDLEKVRALLGHQRIDTPQIYASIRPTQFKRAVGFTRESAADAESVRRQRRVVIKDRSTGFRRGSLNKGR